MHFYDRLDDLLTTIEAQTGISKHRILIEANVDPTQYRAYKKVGRTISKQMLVSLAESTICPCSYNTLMAWKALDEYEAVHMEEALKILKKEKILQPL